MFNAINRFAPLTVLVLLAACGKTTSRSQIEAQMLLESATQAIDAGNPQQALLFLDSIDSAYKNETEIIKESIRLRPTVMGCLISTQIADNDSLLAERTAELDSIGKIMKYVSIPQTDGYYVAGEIDKSFTNSTGISARVSPAGEFYIVSSVNPASGLNHWSVSVIAGSDKATSDTVPYDGVLNYHINNSELISFSSAQSSMIGRTILDNRHNPVTICFNGQKGKQKSISLSSQQVDAIATAMRYSELVNEVRTCTLERERLEKKLQMAKDQSARFKDKVRN